jgi:hypothetical protein
VRLGTWFDEFVLAQLITHHCDLWARRWILAGLRLTVSFAISTSERRSLPRVYAASAAGFQPLLC